MSKPRLLILGPLPPPIGGVENFTQAVLESEAFDEFERQHCNLTKGRPKQTQGKFDIGNIVWAFKHFGRLRASLRSFKPDAIYMPVSSTWSGFFRDAELARIAARSGAKLVGHVHGSWFDRMLMATGWKARVVRKALSRFDALLVLGSPWLKMIQEYGYTGHVEIVPATTRSEVFERGEKFKRDYDKKGSGGYFLGQVGERKGVYDLLEALAGIKKEGSAAKIVFTGPGEFEGDWEALMRKRTELDVEDRAEFTGQLQGESIYKLFEAADYFIMPSYDEGMPAVLFEAGAFGLPVVSSPVGAIPDVLKHMENSILVEPGDVHAIRDAILLLESDSSLRSRLGRQLQSDIQRFRPEKVTAMIADAIRRVLQS
jgi:glycosyltransferase involved in cell wall biosynthesis